MRLLLALAIIPYSLAAAEGGAAALSQALRATGLDPDECYRVREIQFAKEDARIYLTEGHLIFRKPVAGVRTAAVFSADVEGGDGELLLMPPHRSERMALAFFTRSANLEEHFKSALMVFTDDTASALYEAVRKRGSAKSAETGHLLAEAWDPVVRNLSASFEVRLLQDLQSARRAETGFFFAALSGDNLGNFDLFYDPRSRDQITLGQVVYREPRTYFDIWTHFPARSFRSGARPLPGPEFALADFRLDVTLQPDLNLQAETRVRLNPASAGEAALAFEISPNLRVSEAWVDDQPAEVFQRESLRANLLRGDDNEVFLVVPPRPLEAGRSYEIRFRYEGRVIAQAGNRVYAVRSRANWYPQRGLQFSHYDITFRYPKNLGLVASGEVVEHTTDGEWHVTRRKTSTPVRVVGFNLGDYEKASITRSGLQIEVYANRQLETALQARMPILFVPPQPAPDFARRRTTQPVPLSVPPSPPNPTARLEDLASDIAGAAEFMAARFGPPPVRTITASPVPGRFGQGFPGLLYLSTLAYLDPRERPLAERNESQRVFFSEILHAHETAHQWWGNTVASAGYEDEWLQEALANYSALLYLEKRKGARALDQVLEGYKGDLLVKVPADGRVTGEAEQTRESSGPITWGMRLNSSLAPGAWQTITYGKGSWIIHMLRRRLGDERFLSLLGEMARRYRQKGISTEQFRDLAQEFLPPRSVDPKLESFFDAWIYGTGIPALKLSHSVRGKAPAFRVSGTVAQSEVPDDFSVDVPIEISLPKGKITHWVRTGAEPASFSVSVPVAPLKVQLDPANAVLRR